MPNVTVISENNKTIIESTTLQRVTNISSSTVAAGAVTSVFLRTGAVAAQSGDYNADEITETATKVFLTPAEKTLITTNQSNIGTNVTAISLNTAKVGVTNEEQNPDLISQAEAEAGTETTERTFSALRVKQSITANAPSVNEYADNVFKIYDAINTTFKLDFETSALGQSVTWTVSDFDIDFNYIDVQASGIAIGASVTATTSLTLVAIGGQCRSGNDGAVIGYRANKSNSGNNCVVMGSFAYSQASSSVSATILGFNTGLGITTGDYNTCVGASFTFPTNVSNNVVLSDGQGNARFWDDGSITTISNPLISKVPSTTKTANYTIVATTDHSVELLTNSATFTLPAAGTATGQKYCLSLGTSGITLTYDVTGGGTINGVTSKSISTQYEVITVRDIGTEYRII